MSTQAPLLHHRGHPLPVRGHGRPTGRGRRILAAASALTALTALTVYLFAQPAEPATPGPVAAVTSPLDGLIVSEVRILGLQRIDEAYVRNQIRTQRGQPYSQEEIQRDVGRLLRTGRFLDVKAEPEQLEGQVRVTFRLTEKPQVAAIEFVGNRKFKPKDLLEALPFAVGDPLDSYDINQGREAIQRLYREKGYAYAEVSVDEELARSENRVVYTIVENQRVRVRSVRFEGNEFFSSDELAWQIETKAYIPVFRAGDFDPDRAERDAGRIQQYYRERGFLDARVGYTTEFEDVARERLTVVFRISEGVRYKVGQILFEGNQVMATDDLRALLTLKEGEYLIDSVLKSDVRRLETHYGSQGYIEARVVPAWVFAEEPEQVVLTFNIREGQPFRVGWIEVNGNTRTQEKCVRRELRFYPEELWDITRVRKAERRLKETGLFTEATIEPVEPSSGEPGVRDAVVTVEENPQTNRFIAGIGASSDSGIVGNLVLENTNFDLFDLPRSFEEFIKGRSLRGAGQVFRIQLEPGTEFTRFRIDFREPYLLDMPVGFGTSLYLFERGRDGYDERRMGGNVSFDHAFESGPLAGWIGEVALRSEYIDVADRDAFAARDIRDVEGGSFLTSIKFSLAHDTTDSRFNPSEGHRFAVAWEQAGAMGGDYFFSVATTSYTQHWTVAIDDQDRRSIVSAYMRAGQIFGDAPVFERFYAGGIGSFRGFDFRGISPRDGLRRNRIGGDFLLLTGAEYSFPLYAKAVRGVFFADMGTVERDFGIRSWRAAVGAGIRITLDILGTVPMEFDFALPVAKDDEDDTRVFSFFIGLPFF